MCRLRDESPCHLENTQDPDHFIYAESLAVPSIAARGNGIYAEVPRGCKGRQIEA